MGFIWYIFKTRRWYYWFVKKITKETVEIGKIGDRFTLQNVDYFECDTLLKNVGVYGDIGIKYRKN